MNPGQQQAQQPGQGQQPRRRPPPPPAVKEEEAIPLEPAVAKARSAYIRSMVEKVQTLKAEGKTQDEIQTAVERFAADYPGLFKVVMKSEGNDVSLRTMLTMLDRMGSGELSQHQASVIVGQRLHDIYIKPVVNE